MIIYVPDSLARCMQVMTINLKSPTENSKWTRHQRLARTYFMEENIIDFDDVHYYCNHGGPDDHTRIIFGGEK